MIQRKIRLLFISATPTGEGETHGNLEFNELEEIIEKSIFSRYLELKSKLVLNRYQFKEVLKKYDPHILHFAGHAGEKDGIYFQDDDTRASQELNQDTIEKLKSSCKSLRFVFFNACFTDKMAGNISRFVDFALGTTVKIDNDIAIKFSKKFYEAFCSSPNISLKDAVRIAKDYYKGKLKKDEKDYKLFNKEEIKELYLESLIQEYIWKLYMLEYDPEYQDILEYALVSLVNMDLILKSKIVTIFNEFLNRFLDIEFLNLDELDDIEKWDKDYIFLRTWKSFKINEKLKLIELEKSLSLLLKLIKDLQKKYIDDKDDLRLGILGYINSYKKKGGKLAKYIEKETLDVRELKVKLDLLLKNTNKLLNIIKVQNEDEIVNYPDGILLKYCKQQLELSNLASKYDYRYDDDLFVRDDDLCSKFKEFIENVENKNDRQRIFLLLGHMGLGKTWNASFIAYKCLEIGIPTFIFHLGISYQTRFDILLGGFENSNLEQLCGEKHPNRKILLIFDGFDELYEEERNEFIKKLYNYVKVHSKYLMVLLTSRLVDWINTEELAKRTYYKEYIFQNERFEFYENQYLRTGASYILSDLDEEEKMSQILEKYGLQKEKIKDNNVRILLRKPFIVNLVSRINKKLVMVEFDHFNDDWFEIFAGKEKKDTILKRMGIIEGVEIVFQDFIAKIADPYHPIPEFEIRDFISQNKKNWDVILSSGIIKKERSNYQNRYIFNEIYRGLIERYISELEDYFQDRYFCKSDVLCLRELEKIPNVNLNDYTDYDEGARDKGYVVDERKRISELRLNGFQLRFVSPYVYRLIGLKLLNLSDTEIRRISKDIKRLRNLKILDLSNNHLITLPKELSLLPNLEILNINNNQIQEISPWWRNFKKLKTVNISENKYESSESPGFHSIHYVCEGLDFIDDQAKKDGEKVTPLKIKDAVVLDYLNQLFRKNKKIGWDFYYDPEDNHIAKLVLINYNELKSLFWSLENLKRLEFRGKTLKFSENEMIEDLIFIDNQKEQRGELVLHNSIMKLKNIKKITIKGYEKVDIQKGIQNCLKLSHFYLFSDKCRNFPETVLKLKIIKSWIINTTLNQRDFDQLITKYENSPVGILKLFSGIGIRRLTIPENVNNMFFTSINSPVNINIQSTIQRLIIIFDNTTNYRLFHSIKINEKIGTGIFFFLSKARNPSFSLDGYFEKCQYLRFEDENSKVVPIWAFKSKLLKKFYITSFKIKTKILDCFKEEYKGIAESRVHPSCNLEMISENLERATQIRLEYLKIKKLPPFIFTLTQIKYLFITSKTFDQIESKFGSKENEYKLEIATKGQLDLNENLEKMGQISHIFLDNINIRKYEFIASIKNLKFVRIIRGEFRELPDVLENLQNIKHLHFRYGSNNSFKKDFWKDDDKPRFEFELDNQICNLQHLNHITHLRISGFDQISINSQINKNNSIKHLRIDGKLRKLQFIKYLPQIKCVELNITNYILTQIPDLIAQFSFIERIIITTEEIPFKESFWNECSYAYLMMRISIKFDFNILDQFENISHLWIEFLNDQNIPVSLNEMIKTKRFKVLNKNKIELDIDSYLKIENPGYFILIK